LHPLETNDGMRALALPHRHDAPSGDYNEPKASASLAEARVLRASGGGHYWRAVTSIVPSVCLRSAIVAGSPLAFVTCSGLGTLTNAR